MFQEGGRDRGKMAIDILAGKRKNVDGLAGERQEPGQNEMTAALTAAMAIGTTSTGTALKDMAAVEIGTVAQGQPQRRGRKWGDHGSKKITEGQKSHESALPWYAATTLTWKA